MKGWDIRALAPGQVVSSQRHFTMSDGDIRVPWGLTNKFKREKKHVPRFFLVVSNSKSKNKHQKSPEIKVMCDDEVIRIMTWDACRSMKLIK